MNSVLKSDDGYGFFLIWIERWMSFRVVGGLPGQTSLAGPSLLILDELLIIWMSFLSMAGTLSQEISGSILVISHDRAFLESVTERNGSSKWVLLINIRVITVLFTKRAARIRQKESLC